MPWSLHMSVHFCSRQMYVLRMSEMSEHVLACLSRGGAVLVRWACIYPAEHGLQLLVLNMWTCGSSAKHVVPVQNMWFRYKTRGSGTHLHMVVSLF